MLALELGRLDLANAGLRIADPVRRARLEQAIAQQRQQVPVLVVRGEGHRYVLIVPSHRFRPPHRPLIPVAAPTSL